MEWYEYWLVFVGALTFLGTIVSIMSIGKLKPPMTGGVAAVVTIINVITLIALYNILTP